MLSSDRGVSFTKRRCRFPALLILTTDNDSNTWPNEYVHEKKKKKKHNESTKKTNLSTLPECRQTLRRRADRDRSRKNTDAALLSPSRSKWPTQTGQWSAPLDQDATPLRSASSCACHAALIDKRPIRPLKKEVNLTRRRKTQKPGE